MSAKSKLPTRRHLAETLARTANILPEPETSSPEEKIARVKADQVLLQGKGHVRLRRSGESNLLAKQRGLETGSAVHRVVCENFYWRSVNAPRWEQVILLETLYRE